MCFSTPDVPDQIMVPGVSPAQRRKKGNKARDTQTALTQSAQGRSSTILTGPAGAQGQANTNQRTLLGS